MGRRDQTSLVIGDVNVPNVERLTLVHDARQGRDSVTLGHSPHMTAAHLNTHTNLGENTLQPQIY